MDNLNEKTPTACCGPSVQNEQRDGTEFHRAALSVRVAPHEDCEAMRAKLVEIPGGVFDMGTQRSTFLSDQDSPRRQVSVDTFLISPTTVTNSEYAKFVEETGYRTVADVMGWSFVFYMLLEHPDDWCVSPPGLPWWRKVDGASWSSPEGPGTSWQSRKDHPVTHIAWYDAVAYARWAKMRLPHETEWERAARGGLAHKKFPWGNNLVPDSGFAMNTWQGNFPHENTAEDGFVGTAPARSFAPNGYGLFNMTGNVWEWTQDYHGLRPMPKPGQPPEHNPTGPKSGQARIQRGGSFLCHESYCDRYHVHSRSQNDPDSSTSNAGFRIAASLS